MTYQEALLASQIPYLTLLPPLRRAALVINVVRKLDYAQTATELNCCRDTIRSRVSRARSDLRGFIAENRPVPSLGTLEPWRKREMIFTPTPGKELENGLAILENMATTTRLNMPLFIEQTLRGLLHGSAKDARARVWQE